MRSEEVINDKRRKKIYSKEYDLKHQNELKIYRKNYHKIHREEERQKSKIYNDAHKAERLVHQIKKLYNLTLEQVDKLLIKQEHRCAICKKLLKETKRYIDHDHRTGKVRGILCHRCNIGLWSIEDKDYLEKALKYLEREE